MVKEEEKENKSGTGNEDGQYSFVNPISGWSGVRDNDGDNK